MSGFSVFVLNLCVCIGSVQFVLDLSAVCTLCTNWIMCGYSKQPLFELKSLESRQMTAITTKQPTPPTTKYTREIILENHLKIFYCIWRIYDLFSYLLFELWKVENPRGMYGKVGTNRNNSVECIFLNNSIAFMLLI